MTMLLADGDAFVGAIAILAFIGLPIAYAMMNRFLAHQERLEMLRRGIVPPPDPRWAKWQRKAAKGAWYPPPYNVNVGPQQGPPGAQQPYMPFDPYEQVRADRYLRKGITLAMIGLALLIGLSFIDNLAGFPGPWLLGGLIPLFAGIAQIIIALLSGARFSMGGIGVGCGPSQSMAPPPPGAQYEAPPPPGPSNGPRDVTPGPYAWRPGPQTELEPGTRPPDIRQ